MFFNPGFMTDYITTIGRTIYFPSREDILDGKQWDVLAHEGIHLRDHHEHPILFNLSYGFPQILALLSFGAIGAFWNLWFLLFLFFLVAAAPFPAPWRARSERRAYIMSMVCDVIRNGTNYVTSPFYIESMADIYTGSGYYFMRWSKKQALATAELDAFYAASLVLGTQSNPLYSPTIVLIYGASGSTMSGSVK